MREKDEPEAFPTWEVSARYMTMARAENINSDILVWARKTAGLSPEEAAARLHLTDTKKATALEKLTNLETGENKPTRRQLVEIANLYKRPLTVFYRSKPPNSSDSVEDFRTIVGHVTREEDGRLQALLRDVRVRQDMVKSVLEDDEDFTTLPFVGAVTIDQPIETQRC